MISGNICVKFLSISDFRISSNKTAINTQESEQYNSTGTAEHIKVSKILCLMFAWRWEKLLKCCWCCICQVSDDTNSKWTDSAAKTVEQYQQPRSVLWDLAIMCWLTNLQLFTCTIRPEDLQYPWQLGRFLQVFCKKSNKHFKFEQFGLDKP